MSCQPNFNQFVRNISLPAKAVARIESARVALTAFLVASYRVSLDSVFLQGSYANGTAIRPSEGGEYDVDIVCHCVRSVGASSVDALDNLKDGLRANGTYSSRIKRKNPCVRLEYAEDDIGKFHVDVVPVRSSSGAAPFDAPHRENNWHETAPREYTKWCKEQGDQFARTVKMLKHWRSEQQPVREAIKSIVLQVLIADNMPVQIADDSARIAATFANLARALRQHTSPPVVRNPVLPTEDLAASWPQEAYANFKAEVVEAEELSQLAQSQTTDAEAASIWALLFGDDFPSTSARDHGLRLGDQSHAQTPRSRGWTEHLDARYGVSCSARIYRGYWSRHYRKYVDDGAPIFSGQRLRFEAQRTGLGGGELWWQVVNTGGHARSEGGLRGGYFRATQPDGTLSSDPLVNWERAEYTGVHLIRPVLVVGTNLVAKAPWMRVNVINSGRAFRL